MKCTFLALYDWDPGIRLSDLYSCVIEAVAELQDRNAICKLMVKGWPKAKKIFSKELEAYLDSGEFESIEIEAKGDFGSKYLMLSGRQAISKILFLRLPDQSETALLSELVHAIAHLGPIGYGFVTTWNRGSDPVFFALGITYGYPESADEVLLAKCDEKWFEERIIGGKRYLTGGLIKDVFAFNVLNASHYKLLKVMADQSLGTVEAISAHNTTWHVPAATIPLVKRRAGELGVLVC